MTKYGHSAIVSTAGNRTVTSSCAVAAEPNYSARHVDEVVSGLDKAVCPRK